MNPADRRTTAPRRHGIPVIVSSSIYITKARVSHLTLVIDLRKGLYRIISGSCQTNQPRYYTWNYTLDVNHNYYYHTKLVSDHEHSLSRSQRPSLWQPCSTRAREGKHDIFQPWYWRWQVSWWTAVGHYCQSSAMMTWRQPRSTTTAQNITLKSVLCTRGGILVMAKGISNTTIIRALGFTRIDVESVSNNCATGFDGVKIVERWNWFCPGSKITMDWP